MDGVVTGLARVQGTCWAAPWFNQPFVAIAKQGRSKVVREGKLIIHHVARQMFRLPNMSRICNE